ncbi:MAG: class I SAM-dependent methyltransferase [Thermoanaerobaculia bacterium]
MADPVNYWDSVEAHARVDEIWASHPLVRRYINRAVTGDPDSWPTTWLRARMARELPLARTMSIGCGMGQFERDLVRLDIVGHVVGVEISPVCVEEATRLAAESGVSGRIEYRCADAWDELDAARDLDAVLFHASLHHFDRLEELAALVRRALRPGGFLYIDEYVGPSPEEWTWLDELRWNWHYYHLPRSVRRVGRIRPPINYDDPTEAVESSRIVPAIEREFEILERRDYGGNLLAVIYGNLRRPTHDPPSPRDEFDGAVAQLIAAERELLRRGGTAARSFHTVLLARRPVD